MCIFWQREFGSNTEVLNICDAKEEQKKRANCAIVVSAIVILHHASTCLEQPVFPSVPLVLHLAFNFLFCLSPSLAVGAVLAVEFLYCSIGCWRGWEWAALLFLLSCYSISDLCQQCTGQRRAAVWGEFSGLECKEMS